MVIEFRRTQIILLSETYGLGLLFKSLIEVTLQEKNPGICVDICGIICLRAPHHTRAHLCSFVEVAAILRKEVSIII